MGGGREEEGRSRTKGIYVYIWLIQVVVQQCLQHNIVKQLYSKKKNPKTCLEEERSSLHSESAMAGLCFLLFEA